MTAWRSKESCENAVSTTSWSLPSHVSLLTGRYQFQHGIENVQPAPWLGWGRKGLGGFPTLGEMLEQRGYLVREPSPPIELTSPQVSVLAGASSISKIIFTRPPTCSFSTLYGREFARIYLNRTDKSKVKRALRFLGMNSMWTRIPRLGKLWGRAGSTRKRADVANHELLQWIDHRENDRGENVRGETHPFFAFLNYFDVHYPYGGPPTYPKPESGTVAAASTNTMPA